MSENPEVSAWLEDLDHPLKEVILAVRSVFLEADGRISETVTWKSPTCTYKGNLDSIDPKARKHVAVLFHRGAEIRGAHALLEGEGRLARYARFGDLATVEHRREELVAVVRAWCDDREVER
jgi:hypothetical protein